MLDLARQDVLVDLCAQREYLERGSPNCSMNSTQAVENIKSLMAFARWAKSPLLSCVDRTQPHQIGDGYVAIHMVGDVLDQKAAHTLMPTHTVVPCDNCLSVPLTLLDHVQQAIFTKHHRDPFSNPKFDRVLTELPARRFVLFGTLLESSLRMLALGLLRRCRHVTIVQDACGYANFEEALMVLRQLDVKGCELVTTQNYLSASISALAPRRRARLRRGRWVA